MYSYHAEEVLCQKSMNKHLHVLEIKVLIVFKWLVCKIGSSFDQQILCHIYSQRLNSNYHGQLSQQLGNELLGKLWE